MVDLEKNETESCVGEICADFISLSYPKIFNFAKSNQLNPESLGVKSGCNSERLFRILVVDGNYGCPSIRDNHR